MSKSKNTNDNSTPKPRQGKYDKPLKINGTFMDVIKAVVKDAKNMDKKKS
ncbi:MAG: hypothetical protein WBO31_09160 [Saprospiraceae bacterium]|nr:chitobiase/beta-hexosaminidase C-terminal domain-containing protein [Saprospiraceae bacterium]